MVAKVQIKRTSTANSPPADGSLSPGELAVEMDNPLRLWVGVPTNIDATGKKLLVPLGGVIIAETPPANAAAGDIWWENDTGHLFIYYNDGTSSQWVSTSMQGPAGVNGVDGSDGIMAEPPTDGNEYTRINGVWRLSRQAIAVAGQAAVEVPVPAGAQMLFAKGSCYIVGSAATNWITLHISMDGTTYVTGASDYHYAGFQHHGIGGFASIASGMASCEYMNFAADYAIAPILFDLRQHVVRPDATHHFYGMVNAEWHQTAIGYCNGQFRTGLMGTAAGTALDVKKVRFGLGLAGNFGPGSYISCEWVY